MINWRFSVLCVIKISRELSIYRKTVKPGEGDSRAVPPTTSNITGSRVNGSGFDSGITHCKQKDYWQAHCVIL